MTVLVYNRNPNPITLIHEITKEQYTFNSGKSTFLKDHKDIEVVDKLISFQLALHIINKINIYPDIQWAVCQNDNPERNTPEHIDSLWRELQLFND